MLITAQNAMAAIERNETFSITIPPFLCIRFKRGRPSGRHTLFTDDFSCASCYHGSGFQTSVKTNGGISLDKTLQLARDLLLDETPLVRNCGQLCSAACCQGSDTEGMLLFPGEEELYENCAFGRVLTPGYSIGPFQARLFERNRLRDKTVFEFAFYEHALIFYKLG